MKEWDRSFREHYALVTVDDETIVRFGDIDRTGYLDRLYVHKDYQRKELPALYVASWNRCLIRTE